MSDKTMTAWQRRQYQAQEFIAALDQLDTGGRARLKRNAGRTLSDARDIHRVFFQALPYGIHAQQEEDYFLVATLFPLVVHSSQVGSLGVTLRHIRQIRSGSSEGQINSLDRRFQSLLDSDREQLAFRLRQAVRLIAADRDHAALNWEQLLLDLLNWEHPNHLVQLRWARDYFVGSSMPSTNAELKGNES